MKIIFIYFIVAFNVVSAQTTVSQLIKSSKSSVVAIVQRIGTQFIVGGTGFFVNDEGYVVTCYHVVEKIKNNELFIIKSDVIEEAKTAGMHEKMPVYELQDVSKFMKASVRLKDTITDLAILYTMENETSFLEIGNYELVEQGEEVIFLGFPFGINKVIAHKGMISYIGKISYSFFQNGIGIEAFQIDGIVNSGNSGGPVISIQQNKIIGIIKAKYANIGEYLNLIKNKVIATEGIGFGQIDFGRFANEVANAINYNVQMGIGYAISINNFIKLAKELKR